MSAPKTNNDFRALVQSGAISKRVSDKGNSAADDAEQDSKQLERKMAQAAKKKARGELYRRKLQEKEARKAEETKYRDRAKERAEGLNVDYQDVEQVEDVDIEMSKYLGGAIERTHLVKGLDFQLLQRVKEEQDAKQDDDLEQAFEEIQAKDAHVMEDAEPQDSLPKPSGVPQFRCMLGRNVYKLLQPKKAEPLTQFTGGRTTYEFNVDPFVSEQLPTTLIHGDNSDNRAFVSGFVERDTIKRVKEILQVSRHGSKRVKHKERRDTPLAQAAPENAVDGSTEPQEEQVQQQAEVDDAMDDEDIFGDAGHDYDATKTAVSSSSPSKQKGSKWDVGGGSGSGSGTANAQSDGEQKVGAVSSFMSGSLFSTPSVFLKPIEDDAPAAFKAMDEEPEADATVDKDTGATYMGSSAAEYGLAGPKRPTVGPARATVAVASAPGKLMPLAPLSSLETPVLTSSKGGQSGSLQFKQSYSYDQVGIEYGDDSDDEDMGGRRKLGADGSAAGTGAGKETRAGRRKKKVNEEDQKFESDFGKIKQILTKRNADKKAATQSAKSVKRQKILGGHKG